MYNSDDDRRPREGEIIPPGHDGPRAPREEPQVWVTRQSRVFIARPSPWALMLGLFGLGALVLAGVVLLLGLFLLWLPVIGIIAAAAILTALFRGPRRR
jgi:hypothetical protein